VSLSDVAQKVIELAKSSGATDAECTVAEYDEFSVTVRLREVETLTDAGSRGVGVRVLFGQNVGSAYTSDLSREGLRAMVESAVALAAVTSEDPFAGLPEAQDLGGTNGDLQLFSPAMAELDTEHKIEQARRAEAAAMATDPRIFNSEGASFGSYIGGQAFANSRGFTGEYRTTSCSISAVPLARDGESMERDYWYSAARSPDKLEPAEEVGRRAAERAVRRLHARKVPTQRVPVIFESRAARSLLDSIFEAISGDTIYRNESFLAGRLGEKIASEDLTVVDDGTIPGLFGSSPFDDEGVPVRRTLVIERGVLKSYLLNTYTARKLGLRSTGNAARGLTGNARVGHHNLFAEPGATAPSDIIRSVKNGFYVADLMGFGVNIVTGDYSRGAAGLWIENGELAYPVHEVTIAGTLPEMLSDIQTIGSDLDFRGSIACPTLLIGEMMVSGN
jgi:PmbA protein